MPAVSIGLPVYNGARFLASALDSLLGQTYEDLELVVSDNASTDETEEICRDHAARDSRIRYLRHDVNRGAAWNFNVVVRETSAPYFKWAAHDDLLAPTCVERCVEVLEAFECASLVYPWTRMIDENGDLVREYKDGIDLRAATPHERLVGLVRKLVYGNAAFGLMRRSVLEQTRLLGSFPSADYVLLAELALLGEIHEIPEFLFFRREHAGMSRRANATSAEVAEWFEPGSGDKRVREFTRLFVEHFRSIRSMPFGVRERARCAASFADTWIRRNGVHMAEELFGLEYTGRRWPFRRRSAGRFG
jgi:glycosyltransferase involved in cell wall biosynthesis